MDMDSVLLTVFRDYFNRKCQSLGLREASESIDHFEPNVLQEVASTFLNGFSLLALSIPSTVTADVDILKHQLDHSTYDPERIRAILREAYADTDIKHLHDLLHEACADVSTPPGTTALSFEQTPLRRASNTTANSREFRKDMDDLLREEVGNIPVNFDLFEIFFKAIPELEEVAQVVLRRCREGVNPLFDQGWRDWPDDPTERTVLSFLVNLVDHLTRLARPEMPHAPQHRLVGGLSHRPLKGAASDRKVDAAFVSFDAAPGSIQHWSQILVAAELKKNPDEDKHLRAWLHLAKYLREMFNSQDTRRFSLGFTLCASFLRIFGADRMGIFGTTQFDIQQEPLQFIRCMLGFVFMDRKALGFDPTIVSLGDNRHIEIEIQGRTRRLVLREQVSRSKGIATRATTCWVVHFEDDPDVPMMLKEAWQPESRREGEMLQLVTEKGVSNVSRHCHHWTVIVDGRMDDVQNNIRKGQITLEVEQSAMPDQPPPVPIAPQSSGLSRSQSCGSSGRKRTSSQAGLASGSMKPRSKIAKTEVPAPPENRIHQRILMRDVGKPIYQHSSLVELLECLAQCVAGHKQLYDNGVLHRDISINNLMINRDPRDPSRLGFVIDLDHAVPTSRQQASGVKSRTGTWAFISIGGFVGETHSFMHDLESFFWVIFWLVIHYDGHGRAYNVATYAQWEYEHDHLLMATMKGGVIGSDTVWMEHLANIFPYYAPLKPCLSNLRRLVFPENRYQVQEDSSLWEKMQKVLREAKNDPGVKIEAVN